MNCRGSSRTGADLQGRWDLGDVTVFRVGGELGGSVLHGAHKGGQHNVDTAAVHGGFDLRGSMVDFACLLSMGNLVLPISRIDGAHGCD